MLEFLTTHIKESTLIIIRNVALIIVIGGVVLQLVALLVRKSLSKNLHQQTRFIINKVVMYSGVVIILLMVLRAMDVKITALLGAAGIAGIVIGFASQTSIGNLISGIFLISEKSFEIGDLIRVGDTMGVVYTIDLLSVKLKTLDNLLIRIPNQTMISSVITNITRFPIRRMDITVGVAYKEDLQKVMDILKKLAAANPLCLDEPEPLILVKEFGESSIDFLYGLWFEKSNYVKLRNSIIPEIKNAFDAEGVEIPFPHISVYTGEVTKAFPVKTETGS